MVKTYKDILMEKRLEDEKLLYTSYSLGRLNDPYYKDAFSLEECIKAYEKYGDKNISLDRANLHPKGYRRELKYVGNGRYEYREFNTWKDVVEKNEGD